jgi:homocitrate synthase NifV
LSHEDSEQILTKVRQLAIDLKRSLFDKELVYIFEEYKRERGDS